MFKPSAQLLGGYEKNYYPKSLPPMLNFPWKSECPFMPHHLKQEQGLSWQYSFLRPNSQVCTFEFLRLIRTAPLTVI